MLTIIEWRPVPGWPLYEASSSGRIRNRFTHRVLRGRRTRKGYLQVNIYPAESPGLTTGTKPITMLVHRLVCAAFHALRRLTFMKRPTSMESKPTTPKPI